MNLMNRILSYIFDRLAERTTWIGLVGLLSSAGVGVSPDHTQLIATLGTGLVGVILSATKE